MFTGIIEEVGTLSKIEHRDSIVTFTINADKVLEEIKVGDSIATNGVCLTVTKYRTTQFEAELIPETIKKTAFSQTKIGQELNLERALLLNSRLDGHLVSGHIDTTAVLTSIKDLQQSYELTFTLKAPHQGLIVEKGSIAINGISLTIINETDTQFTVGIIPHTFTHTNLKELRPNNLVNIEFDIQGKYILRQLKATHLNFNQLTKWGY